MLGNGIRVCCLIFEEEFFLFFQTTGCCPFNVWFRRLWTDKSSPTRPFFSREFASSSFSRLLHWTNTSILGDGSPRASGLPYAGVAATRVVRERHEMCRGFPLTANTPYREPWNCFCKSAIAENTPASARAEPVTRGQRGRVESVAFKAALCPWTLRGKKP